MLAFGRWRTGARGFALALATACGGAQPEPPRVEAPTEPAPAVPSAPAVAGGSVAPEAATPDDDVHGELVTLGGHRVLRLWGSPTQMGRAHGALLRQEILEIIDGYALDVIPAAALDAAGALYTTTADISPRLREEAEGIVEGMASAGGARSERLGRDLRASDLLVLNAMTDLIAIGCSSVSAWGAGTQDDPSLRGAPVLVRNLDWSDDPELLRNQVVMVYRPDAPDRQAVVSVGFAGYIGCLSCINEAGVAALFNMGYGDGAASRTDALRGFSPANLLLRDTLERRDVDGDGVGTADDLEAAWNAHTHAGSYILHVIEPRRDGIAPARIFEVEADGVSVRTAASDELGGQVLAATNHLRRKAEPRSCSRYERIERTTAAREGRFDRDELWKLGTRLRLPQVVHSVIVEPEARKLAVWLRPAGAQGDDHASPVVHAWAELVGTRGR